MIARIRAMIRRRHASRELKLREGTNRALGFNESPDVFAHKKTCFVVTRTGALPRALAQVDTTTLPFMFRAKSREDFQSLLSERNIDAVLFDFDLPRRIKPRIFYWTFVRIRTRVMPPFCVCTRPISWTKLMRHWN